MTCKISIDFKVMMNTSLEAEDKLIFYTDGLTSHNPLKAGVNVRVLCEVVGRTTIRIHI